MTKPKAELEVVSGDSIVLWVKYDSVDGPVKEKHVVHIREFGHIHIEKETPVYG